MCPLFTSKRDSGFLLGINKEIIHGFSSVEVAVYKINMLETKINIYDEGVNKRYYNPVRLFSQVRIEEKSIEGDDQLTYSKPATFGFLIHDLKSADIIIEEGDVIEYDEGYYTVDQVSEMNSWSGRNPDTLIGMKLNDWEKHGYNISVVANCHLTRTNSLNIVQTINKQTHADDTDTSVPKGMYL